MPLDAKKTLKGRKRQIDIKADGHNKFPKASDTAVIDENMPTKTNQNHSENADVIVRIYKYTSNAGNVVCEIFEILLNGNDFDVQAKIDYLLSVVSKWS